MTETAFDPVRTSCRITASYRRYLASLLSARDHRIGAALQREITETTLLDKGPFLEATPPYRPGATLGELISEGVLCGEFEHLGGPALPLERPLYIHQEAAIRKVNSGRNVVVATGTGSGKTESFLLPILDSLARERTTGTLGPGVRALLLYPMNALANDQMKRMRSLLATYPHITFGRYTGDTENTPQKAKDDFSALNPGEPILRNELLSREEMRATPPHILLTNYAMLEYLLLRPQDVGLFPEDGPQTWRFLAVDEAHVYDGTQGAEIAMLLRRLRDRVAPNRPMRCIATSATVGDDPKAVMEFASSLFGQPFEWVDGDPDRQDLVTASRVEVPVGEWGPLSPADYLSLRDSDDLSAAVTNFAKARGFDAPDGATALAHERGLSTLKNILRSGPQSFHKLVQLTFPGEPQGQEGLVALVAVASALRDATGSPALSARYHLFLRATEGAFTCLSESGPHVHLARHEQCPDCGEAAFELGSCRRCGAIHVVGTTEAVGGRPVLKPRTPTSPASWLALGDSESTDDDEDVVAPAGGDLKSDAALLCPHCAVLNPATARTCSNPECGRSGLRPVRRLRKGGQELAGCLACGARGEGIVRVFETGADAAGAVIATALYQDLPTGASSSDLQLPGEGRKLLMFSDSRQAAAFFAPYVEDTYAKLQRRRLVMQAMERAGASDEPINVRDLVFHTRASADRAHIFRRGASASEEERSVAPWVMAEAISMDDRQSLEGVGLVRISLPRDPAWRTPKPLLDLGLTDDEAWNLLSELVRTLRLQGALTMPDNVPPNHEIFAPRLGPITVRLDGPEAKAKVLSWLPGRGTNRRVGYLTKILAALGSDADPTALLRDIWTRMLTAGSGVDWLTSSAPRGLGVVWQVNHDALTFELVDERTSVFQCSSCERIAPISVRDVCPAAGCDGTLAPFTPPAATENEREHYRAIYRGMRPVPLSAIEHTAQWRNTEAAAIQQRFIRGEVNALSCSTTFELGVDVGELQSVLLRNVPPTTANYVQRAGRAGRRAGAAALVVTYAQRRSHDLTHFDNPTTMMNGSVRAPYVPLENPRIDRRHAHSVALAAFFRHDLATFNRISRKAGDFFLPDDAGREAPAEALRAFLSPVPVDVEASLRRILPSTVQAQVGMDDGSWVERLLDLVAEVGVELHADLAALKAQQDAALVKRNFGLAGRFEGVMKTIRERDLLGFLASHNVIPKYGFPTDTVELRTNLGQGAAAGSQLELSRDLTQAIHEYAPDATLVAGGHLWTSRGIYRLPGKELERIKYLVCQKCGHYWESLGDLDPQCPLCHHHASSAARDFVIPEFGFVADPQAPRPGTTPPRGAWSGGTHVVQTSPEATVHEFTLPGGRVVAAVGPRGRLVSVADGPGGRGYWVCSWCGWGTSAAKQRPKSHDHLLRAGHQCSGFLELVDLGHRYETDLLDIELRANRPVADQATWKSVLYALLEAASATQQIARDDIGGTVRPTGPLTSSLTLFDTVPGGGGNVLRIADHLPQVLRAALRRVESCECGPETSCYGCLRGYRNQRDHEVLSRGAAAHFLADLGVQ